MAATPNSSEARRRIRDNPLFTSSPLDLLGANMRRSLELEFDDCSDDDGKENISSLANRMFNSERKAKAKRFELEWISQFEQGTQSLSVSTSSESSSDSAPSSAGEAIAYDPRQNLRTARPEFLRYRPDWRLELLSSFEDQVCNAEFDHKSEAGSRDQEVSSSHQAEQETETEQEAEQETKTKQEAETVLGADSEAKTAPEAELEAEEAEEKTEIKAVDKLEAEEERETSETVLVPEQQEQAEIQLEEASGEELAEQPVCTYAKACFALFGIFFLAALLAAAATAPCFISDSVWGSSSISSYTVVDPGLVFGQAATSYPSPSPSPSSEQQPDVFSWEWFGEYDTAAYGSVLQEEIRLPMTDSDELNALLRTIMTGTEAEIQEKYLEVMESDEEPGSVLVEDLQGGTSPAQLEDSGEEVKVVQEIQVESEAEAAATAAAAAAAAATAAATATAAAAEAEEIFQEEQEVDTHSAAENTDTTLSTTSRLPSTYEVSIFMSAITIARALLTYCKKKPRGSSTRDRAPQQDSKVVSSTATTTMITTATEPTIRPGAKAKFEEDVMFEPLALEHTPYGSITGYKRVVLNEGAGKERVTLTPVRRSSRIRQHLTQSPPVARRRL